MTSVKLQWATPEADQQIMFMARVSNPEGQNSGNPKLLRYCMEHGHVSPFEMASACLEINVPRDIGRQIIRHRSFSFQEFSQRYQDATVLDLAPLREARLQDQKNRQNSLPTDDRVLHDWWMYAQGLVDDVARKLYAEALSRGIAKEVARAILPEGLTMSRLYMSGTIRSWVHYLKQRLDPSTQAEHREVAEGALAVLRGVAPITMEAFFPVDDHAAG